VFHTVNSIEENNVSREDLGVHKRPGTEYTPELFLISLTSLTGAPNNINSAFI